MRRKLRGAKGRLASPAQMARLEAVLQVRYPRSIPFESYRHLMRESLHPEADPFEVHAAWEHQYKKGAAGRESIAAFSAAVHAQRATESGDVIQ